MTSYQSTSYNVAEAADNVVGTGKVPASVVFSTVAGQTDVLNEDLVLRVYGHAHLTLDDVRGLQAFLNDQFGRGAGALKAGVEYPFLDGDVQVIGPEAFVRMDGQVLSYQGRNYVPQASEEDNAPTWNPIEAQRAAAVLPGTDAQAEQFLQAMESASDAIGQMQQPGANLDYYPDTDPAAQTWNPQVGETVNVYPARMEPQGQDGYVVVPTSNPAEQNVTVAHQQPATRQCPHISNGVQCAYAEHGPESMHSYEPPSGPAWPTLPQTGDGATTPPAAPLAKTVAPVGEQAAESANGASNTEVPSPSAEPLSADLTKPKKTVNRRKKEEKAYDDALEAFRAQPTSQLEYVALTNAAEALRKRFPDAARLENWDAHIRLQNVQVLLGDNPAPHQETGSAPVQPEPHFAPELSAPAQPTPFVPPAPAEPSAEELQAGQAFPCQHVSASSGRQCTRPAGHELASPPKPHFYPPLEDGQSLPVPSFTQEPMSTGVPGFTVTPVNEGNGFTQATIPPFQIPQPTADQQASPFQMPGPVYPDPSAQALSFQVPPTPEGADLQPPAPAAPPWSAI